MAKKGKNKPTPAKSTPAPQGATGGPRLAIDRVPLSSLVLDPANARSHPDRNLDAIGDSLRSFGQVEPLVVQRGTGRVIGGNGRLAVMRREGQTHADVVYLDIDDHAATRLGIALNRTAELAEWDKETLASLLDGMGEADLLTTGFDADSLKDLLADLTPPVVVEDEAPAPLPDPVSKPGDLWELGGHRLLCGDSTKGEDVGRVMGGQRADLCFTSPPYASQRKYDESSGFKPIKPSEYVEWWGRAQSGIRATLKQSGSLILNIKEAADEGQKQDYVKRLVLRHIDEWGWLWIEEYIWPRPALPLDPNTSRRFKNAWESVFHFALSKDFVFNPDAVRHESDGCFSYKDQKAAGKKICDGGQGLGGGAMSPVGQHTGLAYASNMLPNFGGAKVVGHSAAFPVGLPAFFIRCFSPDDGVVYEPFSGSGTTIVASEETGRTCRAIELSGQYVDVAVRRWEKLTGKQATLNGQTFAQVAAARGVALV